MSWTAYYNSLVNTFMMCLCFFLWEFNKSKLWKKNCEDSSQSWRFSMTFGVFFGRIIPLKQTLASARYCCVFHFKTSSLFSLYDTHIHHQLQAGFDGLCNKTEKWGLRYSWTQLAQICQRFSAEANLNWAAFSVWELTWHTPAKLLTIRGPKTTRRRPSVNMWREINNAVQLHFALYHDCILVYRWTVI